MHVCFSSSRLLLPEISDEQATRIVRRLARLSGIVHLSGNAFGYVWTLLMSTLGALIFSLSTLDVGPNDTADDESSYSSGDETPTTKSNYDRLNREAPPGPATRQLLVKPNIVLINHVATSIGLSPYYSGQADDAASSSGDDGD